MKTIVFVLLFQPTATDTTRVKWDDMPIAVWYAPERYRGVKSIKPEKPVIKKNK